MELKILRPTSSQTFDINWLEAQTDQGNFVILPGHAPMIILLASGKPLVMELSDSTKHILNITAALLQVTRNSLTLLISQE